MAKRETPEEKSVRLNEWRRNSALHLLMAGPEWREKEQVAARAVNDAAFGLLDAVGPEAAAAHLRVLANSIDRAWEKAAKRPRGRPKRSHPMADALMLMGPPDATPLKDAALRRMDLAQHMGRPLTYEAARKAEMRDRARLRALREQRLPAMYRLGAAPQGGQ